MKPLSNDRIFVSARIRRIHKAQLDELALAEGRTKSSMMRCLIERAYRDLFNRAITSDKRNGMERKS